MKNQKGGIVWLLISFVCANTIAFSTRCYDYDNDVDAYRRLDTWRFFGDKVFGTGDFDILIPFFSICAFLILLCFLFIRKNGKSAWSLLQKRTKNFKYDKLYIAYTIIIAFMTIVTLMSWTW